MKNEKYRRKNKKSVKNDQTGVNDMHNREREQEILNILKTTNGFVSTKQLCNMLYASESSIRRDLNALEERNLVKRSYGGVMPVSNFSNIVTFNQRTKHNMDAKREIAKKAVSLIQKGQIIFLDQSSTAFYLASELLNFNSLTVVTNNIEIMMLLSNSSIRVIASGGVLSDENRNCLIGGDAQNTFQNIYADMVFFSVKAISDDGAVTDCSREEILVRNEMLKNARQRVLLCDSSKMGKQASFKQCHIQDIDYLISEGVCAQQFSAFENKIKLL